MKADFRAQLDAARRWEIALAKWIRSRGWYVVPTYDFSGGGDGKAPKMLGPRGHRDLVLPDLQCFRPLGDVRAQWLECKWKSGAALYRKGGYPVTGIGLRLAKHYSEVEQQTGQRVVVAFLHEAEGEMRAAPLQDLPWSHDYEGTVMGRGGMRFWRWNDIPAVCRLAEISKHIEQPIGGAA